MRAQVVGTSHTANQGEITWTIVVARLEDREVAFKPNALDVPEDVRAALRAWVK